MKTYILLLFDQDRQVGKFMRSVRKPRARRSLKLTVSRVRTTA